MKWFTICWYKYLFSGCSSLRNFLCRLYGHRAGPIWYNASGLEPDMHCRNCGENLG